MLQCVLGSSHGKEMTIWERQLFTLDVSPEWFLWGCQHGASSERPAWLFDQQAFCPACTTADLPTPPDQLTSSTAVPRATPSALCGAIPSCNRTVPMEVRLLLLSREKLSPHRWEGTARAQLGCSPVVLRTEMEILPRPPAPEEPAASPIDGGCWAEPTACCSQCCLSPFHTPPLEAAGLGATLSTGMIKPSGHFGIAAYSKPRDDHTWSPSCCCSCPSATLARCLLLWREPPFTKAEAPASLQGCACSHVHAAMSAWDTSAWGWTCREGTDHQWWDFICSVPVAGDDHPKWQQTQARRHDLKGQETQLLYQAPQKTGHKPASVLHFDFKGVWIWVPMSQAIPKLPTSASRSDFLARDRAALPAGDKGPCPAQN